MQFLLTLCNGSVYIKVEAKALKKPYNDDFIISVFTLKAISTAFFQSTNYLYCRAVHMN